MSEPPRLLVVSPRFLFPLDQGGKIRTANILRRMKGGAFHLTLASPAPAEIGFFAEAIADICDSFLAWPERRPSGLRRALALAGSLPVAVAADRSAAGRACVERALAARPAVVLADFPHAGVLLPPRLAPPSVLFTHNVEAEIFARHAALARGPWRLIWREQARKMRAFEGAMLARFDRVIAVSARDAAALQRAYGARGIALIDTGVDLDFYGFTAPAAAPAFGREGGTVVFTGAMDWRANIDAIAFLMDEVWPLVTRARPAARAVIVGRNPPAALLASARERGVRFSFTGFVDDIRPHVADGHVYVIPLRVGSGTRIKAFEAMAMGRPVVSTRIGVEGLDVAEGEHFLAADAPTDFAAAILRLLDELALRERLARAARERLEARFSWTHVARQFEAICLSALQRREGPDGPG